MRFYSRSANNIGFNHVTAVNLKDRRGVIELGGEDVFKFLQVTRQIKLADFLLNCCFYLFIF